MINLDDLQAELDGVGLGDLPDDLSPGLRGLVVGIQAEIYAHRSQLPRAAASLEGVKRAIFWLKIAVDSAHSNKKIRDKLGVLNRRLVQEPDNAQCRSDVALLEKMFVDSRAFERDVLEQSALSINRMPDDFSLDEDDTSGFRV